MAHIADLQFALEYSVPKHATLFRIQRLRNRKGARRYGGIRVSGAGEPLRGRFDLGQAPVAYFAESPETAVYEVMARREAEILSVADAALRGLLYATCRRPLRLLDVRPHANAWPFLQATRFQATQQLARSVANAGYEGLVYKSAQQHGADCFAIFGEAALRSIRVTASENLVGPNGELHQALSSAARGAAIMVTT